MRDIPKFINDLALELNKNEMNFRKYLSEKENDFNEIVKPYLI